MKRFIVVCLLAATLFTLMAVGVFASEEVPPVTVTADNIPTADSSEDFSETPPAADPLPDSVPAVSDEEEPENTTSRSFGETVNYIWDTYAGEIFSALTLISSLVLAYFYKRGLVPTIWNGLNTISRTTEAATDAAKGIAESTDGKLSEFIQTAAPLLDTIRTASRETASMAESVLALETRLAATDGEREKMKAMMAGVADLLYGVFTAANLPTYAKEQLGQRYNALTCLLNDQGDPHDTEKETNPL